MNKTLIAIAALAMLGSSGAYAQASQSNGCTPGATNCTGSNQNSGDITNPGTSNSASTQLGNSSASIASGTTIDTRPQVTQNATNTTSGFISGGNTNSSATGGSATGNLSSNDNHSSASTGASTSNSGGNNLATGPSTSSVGNTTSLSQGGAGGAGGAGGNGGSATGGSSRATGGNSSQGQQQGQGQGQSSTNTNGQSSSLTGGNQASTLSGGNQRSNLQGGNNAATTGSNSSTTRVGGSTQTTSNDQNVGNGQTTTIGGSNYSDNSRTIFIPPVVPPTPPSSVGIGQVVQTVTACGPLQQVVKTPVVGTYFGFFTNDKITQGDTYDLAPVLDDNFRQITYRREQLDNGDIRLIGSQAIIYATVVSIAGARSIALGGGSSSGSWGQGGGGSSASMSQLVTNIQIHECEIGTIHMVQAPVIVETQPIIETPREVLKRKIVRHRKIADCTPAKH